MVSTSATGLALLLLVAVNSAHAARSLHSGGPPPSSGSGGPAPAGSGGFPIDRPGAALYHCPPGSVWTTCSLTELQTIAQEIVASLADPTWDDGNRAGVYIRGAWHNCGSYNASASGAVGDRIGGCSGAHMRFSPERDDPADAGLELRAPTTPNTPSEHELLDPILARHPCITHADLWTLAGTMSFRDRSGGKMVPMWRPGRCDAPDGSDAPPFNRLPDASFRTADGSGEAAHLRDVFHRMMFTDKDIVTLSGIGHRMGRCHQARSNFDGTWDHNAINFDTAYFSNLMGNQWGLVTQMKNTLTGQMVTGLNKQYVNNNGNGNMFMLPTDMALRQDPSFSPYVNNYIANQDQFYNDGAVIFATLMENAVERGIHPELDSMWI